MAIEDHIHKHRSKNISGSGWIVFGENRVNFEEATFYLETDDLKREQRVCIKLDQNVNEQNLKDFYKPFGKLEFKEPIYVGSIPLRSVQIYLLGSIISSHRVDVLVSPENKLVSKLLPVAFDL